MHITQTPVIAVGIDTAVLAPAAKRQMNQQQKQQERTCYYEVWSEHVILL